MFIIILYVLTIILYTELGMLVVSKIDIDKNSNTTYIRSNYCINMQLIVYY